MGNFDFLKSRWAELAKLGELAEQYLYSDTNTCFFKMGLLAEHIVQYMLAYDGIPQPESDNTHANRITHNEKEEQEFQAGDAGSRTEKNRWYKKTSIKL